MKTNLLLVLAAAAALVSGAAETVESVAAKRHYNPRYCAVTDTPEARAQLVAELFKRDPARETRLWPEGKVPLQKNQKPLKVLEHELWQRNVVLTDVNDPFFAFFPAPGATPRPVVVILPGGGYFCLGWNKEGTEVADWLNSLGFSAAVLVYRAPNQRTGALCDVQRAIRLLRHDAKKYNIDPASVGVIGFSAGANLAVTASTQWRTRAYQPLDAADRLSCRPDFQLPIYPWDLRPRVKSDAPHAWRGMTLRPDYPVDGETPPAFIAQSEDDGCQIETAVTYDYFLRQAGVPSELCLVARGGHGYGLRTLGAQTDIWNDKAASWLAQFARPARRVLFLGDSITDPHHIGCSKNYWGFLGDWYGFQPAVCGLNGRQMNDIPNQAKAYRDRHGADPDVIFVFAGTNDYNANVPLGSWFTVKDAQTNRNGRTVTVKQRTPVTDDTFRGRINRAILALRELYPLARIVLLPPIHRGFAQFGRTNVQPDESFSNERGLFIDDYVAAVKEAGNVWGVTVVDINATSGLYPSAPGQTPLVNNAKTDRLHPSTAGHRRIAEAIALAVGDLLKR